MFKQVNWLAILPHILLVVGLSFLLTAVGLTMDTAVLLAAMIYLSLSILLQNVLPFDHRKGIKLLKQGDPAGAREAFQNSYKYFTEKSWMDDYRAITMLSASKMSYKEMALVNVAITYLEEEQPQKAREAYLEALKVYPDCSMAKSAIAYLDEQENESDEELEDYEKEEDLPES